MSICIKYESVREAIGELCIIYKKKSLLDDILLYSYRFGTGANVAIDVHLLVQN